jgi:hypothetical protein
MIIGLTSLAQAHISNRYAHKLGIKRHKPCRQRPALHFQPSRLNLFVHQQNQCVFRTSSEIAPFGTLFPVEINAFWNNMKSWLSERGVLLTPKPVSHVKT